MSVVLETAVDRWQGCVLSLSGFLELKIGFDDVSCVYAGEPRAVPRKTGQARWLDHCEPATADSRCSKNNNKIYVF